MKAIYGDCYTSVSCLLAKLSTLTSRHINTERRHRFNSCAFRVTFSCREESGMIAGIGITMNKLLALLLVANCDIQQP